MDRQEAEHAQTVLREADSAGRLQDLEIVDLYTPETAHVESPLYTILTRTKDGHARHISDYQRRSPSPPSSASAGAVREGAAVAQGTRLETATKEGER